MVGATDNLALKVFAAPEHLSVQVNSIQFNTIYLVVSLIKNANNNTFPLPKTSEKNCKFLFHYLGQSFPRFQILAIFNGNLKIDDHFQ